MAYANVKLSKSELQLVCNEEFILTKNAIIDKVYLLFGELGNHFGEEKNELSGIFPGEVLKQSPKIYKGEQYKAMPYVMLDYPRYFTKSDAFTIRCFFWWGNFFSITLQLEGSYAETHAHSVLNALAKENNDWNLCISEDKWQHHFELDNYVPATKQNIAAAYDKSKLFLKIAKKIPLIKWDDAYNFFIQGYTQIFEMLSSNTE